MNTKKLWSGLYEEGLVALPSEKMFPDIFEFGTFFWYILVLILVCI